MEYITVTFGGKGRRDRFFVAKRVPGANRYSVIAEASNELMAHGITEALVEQKPAGRQRAPEPTHFTMTSLRQRQTPQGEPA